MRRQGRHHLYGSAHGLYRHVQVGTLLLKQALILQRRFRGKHSELELAILAADNMIC